MAGLNIAYMTNHVGNSNNYGFLYNLFFLTVMGVVIFVIVAVGIITILLIIFCCNKGHFSSSILYSASIYFMHYHLKLLFLDQRYNLEHRDRERLDL